MNSNNVNIYSEPLFGSPGCTPLSSTSSAGTQSQSSGLSCVIPLKDDKCQSQDGATGIIEVEKDGEFRLESTIISALELQQQYCTTGCPNIDKFLKGGIPTFGLTEFYGEAGTGKTQFCLQLALMAQLPENEKGLDSGVFFICTEGTFPSKRLAEMISQLQQLSKVMPEEETLMSNIFIEKVSDMESLAYCVEVKLPMLARQHRTKKIRMVILDSVAGIFRYEYDNLIKRTYELRQLAQNLHEYSNDHDAAIVVCNQVSASLDQEANVASLGMAWKNMVSTRICLSKDDANSRRLEINFSPYLPPTNLSFQISAIGLNSMGEPIQK